MKKMIMYIGVMAIFTGSAVTSYAGYFNNTPISRCGMEITRSLSRGSENSEVYMLQEFLARAGYLYATPNGYFGYATERAVMSFQRDNYISRTGTVGPQTRNAINERLCDSDPRGDAYNTYGYGYNTGTTYVDPYDPFVKVISPEPTNPHVYTTPQNGNTTSQSVYYNSFVTPGNTNTSYTSSNTSVVIPVQTPSSQIAATNIIYSSQIGYTYGITPTPGSITITSPLERSTYNEGDTINLAWTTKNMNVSTYRILLENIQSGRSREVAVTSNTQASIVLTKDTLDYVCAGGCTSGYQDGSYRISITTPYTDIAGNTSTFKASVSSITINRPLGSTTVSFSGSKNPVDSGEGFRLYVNIPANALWNTSTSQYSIRVRSVCTNNITVSVGGYPCGQDLIVPVPVGTYQQEVPAMITNLTWYSQTATFELTVTGPQGQVVGTATTQVTVNPRPIAW